MLKMETEKERQVREITVLLTNVYKLSSILLLLYLYRVRSGRIDFLTRPFHNFLTTTELGLFWKYFRVVCQSSSFFWTPIWSFLSLLKDWLIEHLPITDTAFEFELIWIKRSHQASKSKAFLLVLDSSARSFKSSSIYHFWRLFPYPPIHRFSDR